MFTTVFSRVRHWSLSWARCIQYIHSDPIYLRFILKLFFHICLDLPSGTFPSTVHTSHLSHAFYMPRQSHRPRLDHPNNIWWCESESYFDRLRLWLPVSFLHYEFYTAKSTRGNVWRTTYRVRYEFNLVISSLWYSLSRATGWVHKN
jgi:hypothetical protein